MQRRNGSGNDQITETEILHGTRHGPDVSALLGLDQHDAKARHQSPATCRTRSRSASTSRSPVRGLIRVTRNARTPLSTVVVIHAFPLRMTRSRIDWFSASRLVCDP